MPCAALVRLIAFAALVALVHLFGARDAAARPATADVVPGEEHCVVNVRADDVLNLRAGPGSGHRVVTGLRYGTCGVLVTGECRGNWCPVEDGHHVGWVHARFVAMVSPARYCVAGATEKDPLALRAFPAHESRVLATLGPATCSIAFLPYATNGWQKIRVGGYEGWVPRANLSGQ